MVMAFYVKLGALFLKQVSKPLASQLKKETMTHPELKRLVTKLGQKMHEWNVSVTNSINENGRQAFAGKLDDEVALKKAADFIGEVFIFAVAGGIVVYEVNSSAKKDAAKAEALAQKEQKVLDTLADLKASLEASARRVDALERRIATTEGARSRWGLGLWPWRSTLSEPGAGAMLAPS